MSGWVSAALEKEIKKSTLAPADGAVLQKRLEQEKRKVQNLLRALEDGATAPAVVLKAIAEKENAIADLEVQVRAVGAPRATPKIADAEGWVRTQLEDLAGLLHDDVPTVKAEFRRLNLALTFTPTDAQPRPHYVVKGQCDLSALVFSFVWPAERLYIPPSNHKCVRSRLRYAPLGAAVGLLGVRATQCRKALAAPSATPESP